MKPLKDDLKIFRYIYSKRAVSFGKLKRHFKNRSDIPEVIRGMLSSDCITIVSGIDKSILEGPIPDSCILDLTEKAVAMIEENQWFNWEFIVKELVFPIIVSVIVSVITTLITLFLTGANLSPCQ